MSSDVTLEKFREKIARAYEKEMLTDIQKEALLAKFEGLDPKKNGIKTLTVQNRNALRILRDIVYNKSETTITLSKTLLRAYILQELLSIVDKPKGILCPTCHVGTMTEGTSSEWINNANYDLVIEQIPSRNCMNPDCEETIFSSETVKVVETIAKILQNEIPKLHDIKIKIDERSCPICGLEHLQGNKKSALYKHRQGLFHLRIKDIPLEGYCSRCGYEKHSKKVSKEVNKLLEKLYEQLYTLLGTKP